MAKRVLVVDDQPYLRDVQVLVLKEAGYEATAVASGGEALERIEQLAPDLILLDVSMPGMNGRQFVARLRAGGRWGALPVLLSTGMSAETALALVPGSADVLPKPFSDADLLDHVRRLIGEA